MTATAAGANRALALLLAINLFNYLDRFVLAAVLPKIAADPAVGPLSKAEQGALATAFMVAYLAFSPIFGWLGDRGKRWLLVGVGVTLWSLASGASGLASGYVMLLLTRCFVGVGEAAYGPVAPSVLSDLYPIETRGKVMAWFYVAIPVGGAFGFLFGGLIADSTFGGLLAHPLGWRWAFLLVVPPGLILGGLCFLMRDTPIGAGGGVPPGRPGAAAGGGGPRPSPWVLAHIPSYVLNTVATTALSFTVGGIATWMPSYIYERQAFYQWTDQARDKLAAGTDALPPAVLGALDRRLRNLDGTGRVFPTTHSFDEALSAGVPADDAKGFKDHRARILEEARDPAAPGLGDLNFRFSVILAVGGLAATVFGGWLGDRLRDRGLPGAYALVCGWSAIAGVPCFLAVLVAPFPWAWGLLFAAVFCLFVYTGPSNTILANVVPPAVRSTGFAVNILVIHLLGDAISPWVIGRVADDYGLGVGFGVVTAVILVGGAAWLLSARYLAADTANAPTLLEPPGTDTGRISATDQHG